MPNKDVWLFLTGLKPLLREMSAIKCLELIKLTYGKHFAIQWLTLGIWVPKRLCVAIFD
jgi:hypothetical protein